ncbi:radical SAM protein [Micromonospora sp. LOL_021]|uniref:radical SAM protein n=1 Tax=Micromonospora sp. LOL_021 TaxID=3345417 RepID=UPI003A89D1BE
MHLAPDINRLPFVDRVFLADDPYLAADGRLEANMVGARGCPYDCSFCGAAVSANPDITIRTRTPENIIGEMVDLQTHCGVTAFRFVDDLFLGYERFIRPCMATFTAARIGDRFVWDATGRINILHRMSDDMLQTLKLNGCREVAFGIESGSERVWCSPASSPLTGITTWSTPSCLPSGQAPWSSVTGTCRPLSCCSGSTASIQSF